MKTPAVGSLLCSVGLHRWYGAHDPDDRTDTVECSRCHAHTSRRLPTDKGMWWGYRGEN